jgi:hypothetical protein
MESVGLCGTFSRTRAQSTDGDSSCLLRWHIERDEVEYGNLCCEFHCYAPGEWSTRKEI